MRQNVETGFVSRISTTELQDGLNSMYCSHAAEADGRSTSFTTTQNKWYIHGGEYMDYSF
jgi:hypothetical protein